MSSQDHANPPATRWLALGLLSLAQLMLIIDVTVVNIALPELSDELSLGAGMAGWMIAAYAIPFGSLLLIGGRLADRFGPRRLFLSGIALFTGASLGAGLAPDASWLLAARTAQGVGAALLSPAALSSVTLLFAGSERHRALAIWGAVGGAGAALGVLAGGLLTGGPGWRWIFFVNVPIGVVVAFAVPLVVPAMRAAAGAFPLRALVRRPALTGAAMMLGGTGLLVGGFFTLSFRLQDGLGFSPTLTGLSFLPVALGALAGAHAAGHLVMHLGAKGLAALGFGLAAAGLGGTMLASGSALLLVAAMSVATMGCGMVLVAATVTAMTSAGAGESGVVSGLVNTFHELGAAGGVSVLAMAGGGFGLAAGVATAAMVLALLLVPAIRPAADAPRFAH